MKKIRKEIERQKKSYCSIKITDKKGKKKIILCRTK